MTTKILVELNAICNAAIPGPWELGDIDYGKHGVEEIAIDAIGPISHGAIAKVVWKMEDDTRSPQQEATASFIATFNPEMVKKLLAVAELAYDFQEQINEHAMERGISPALHPLLAEGHK